MVETNAVQDVQDASTSVENTAPATPETPADAADTPTPPQDAQQQEAPQVAESSTEPQQEAPPEEQAPSIEVTHTQPDLVEPVPPKDIFLPDTPEIRRICKVYVPIIVKLAEKVMSVGEITQLAPGTIIEFNKTVGEPLHLMINNKTIGNGQTVKVGEKFGLRIQNIMSLDKVIQAMVAE